MQDFQDFKDFEDFRDFEDPEDSEEIDGYRIIWNLEIAQWIEVFQHCSAEVPKEEAENIGLQGKDIAEYVTRQQTLDREEREAWRDTQKKQGEYKKMQAQAQVELARVRAEAEEKKEGR